jgi:hypothetical protein
MASDRASAAGASQDAGDVRRARTASLSGWPDASQGTSASSQTISIRVGFKLVPLNAIQPGGVAADQASTRSSVPVMVARNRRVWAIIISPYSSGVPATASLGTTTLKA